MLRILTALDTLEPAGKIVAKMDRRPMFLFPELDERGCAYTCDPDGEGGFLLIIDKR